MYEIVVFGDGGQFRSLYTPDCQAACEAADAINALAKKTNRRAFVLQPSTQRQLPMRAYEKQHAAWSETRAKPWKQQLSTGLCGSFSTICTGA